MKFKPTKTKLKSSKTEYQNPLKFKFGNKMKQDATVKTNPTIQQ